MQDGKSFLSKVCCEVVYSIYDAEAEEHGPLYQCVNDRIAVIKFLELIKKYMIGEFRDYGFIDLGNYEKFHLYSRGVYDKLEGTILPEVREISVFEKIEEVAKKIEMSGCEVKK